MLTLKEEAAERKNYLLNSLASRVRESSIELGGETGLTDISQQYLAAIRNFRSESLSLGETYESFKAAYMSVRPEVEDGTNAKKILTACLLDSAMFSATYATQASDFKNFAHDLGDFRSLNESAFSDMRVSMMIAAPQSALIDQRLLSHFSNSMGKGSQNALDGLFKKNAANMGGLKSVRPTVSQYEKDKGKTFIEMERPRYEAPAINQTQSHAIDSTPAVSVNR